MTTGLIYVSFGANCDHIAAHCIAFSRQYTKLPICVLTNIPEAQRHKKWADAPDIDFIMVDLPLQQNRQVKTSLPEYTPFDYSIYLDADSIIQKEGFDEEIERLVVLDNDIILNHFCTFPYPDNGKFQNIYLRALNQFGCSMPLKVYNGAFIGFKNNNNGKEFFTTWNRLWREFGAAREMPPLACAINLLTSSSGLTISELPLGFFSPDVKNMDSVVQHNYHDDFWQRIGSSLIHLHQASYSVDDYHFTVV